MAHYAYDNTYASGKVSLDFLFPKWRYWGESFKNGAIYKIANKYLVLNNKKVKILDKDKKDITELFKDKVNLLNNDIYNRILLKSLINDLKNK